MERPIVVVGGGLAGLTAACHAAASGRPVVAIERAETVGGRARSRRADGFALNLGPHALYAAGAGAEVLRELGVQWSGGDPARLPQHAFAAGRLHLLPSTPLRALLSRLLSWRAKLGLGRWLATLRDTDPASLARTTVAQWTETDDLRLTQTLRAVVRIATYGGDPARMSADAAARQIQLALDGGVRYLDGGWQTLVDGLRAEAARRGVRQRTGIGVARITRRGACFVVELTDGGSLHASAVVLAVGPHVASRLSGSASLARFCNSAEPVRLASLDLALGRPVPRTAGVVLGIDRPLYLSVHSRVAGLAPRGASLVHVAKYLGTAPASPDDRDELEALLDLVIGDGWRGDARHVQHLPRITVHEALPTAETGGLTGRPGAVLGDAPGIFVAGDWVGPDGLLADAALASGREAGHLAARSAALSSLRAA